MTRLVVRTEEINIGEIFNSEVGRVPGAEQDKMQGLTLLTAHLNTMRPDLT